MASYFIQLPVIGGGGGGAVDSVNGYTGVVVLTKSDIGLSNVDNTSDLNKPISTATQNALNNKVEKTGDTMTGVLNMSALSENIQFSVYGMNSTQGMEFRSDTDTTRPTGNVKLTTGNASGPHAAGSIYLQGGSNVNGNPGNIQLTAGQSSGTGSDGIISFDAKGVVYLNQNASGTLTACNHRLENVANPTSAQDAATKAWVESVSTILNAIFVRPNASIFGADGSLFKPYASIAAALAVAVDNNVIVLMPGTYNESKVTIPSSISYITFKAYSSGSTNVANGFSYIAGSGANVDLVFDGLSMAVLTLNLGASANGLITVKNCSLSLDRTDSANATALNISNSFIIGGSTYGATILNNCLIIASIDVYSILFLAENCKFVSSVTAYDNALIRVLNCSLFGATEFVNGVFNTSTPTLEIDLASNHFGSYIGTCTKILLAELPLSNITQSNATTGQFPAWNGSNWVASSSVVQHYPMNVFNYSGTLVFDVNQRNRWATQYLDYYCQRRCKVYNQNSSTPALTIPPQPDSATWQTYLFDNYFALNSEFMCWVVFEEDVDVTIPVPSKASPYSQAMRDIFSLPSGGGINFSMGLGGNGYFISPYTGGRGVAMFPKAMLADPINAPLIIQSIWDQLGGGNSADFDANDLGRAVWKRPWQYSQKHTASCLTGSGKIKQYQSTKDRMIIDSGGSLKAWNSDTFTVLNSGLFYVDGTKVKRGKPLAKTMGKVYCYILENSFGERALEIQGYPQDKINIGYYDYSSFDLEMVIEKPNSYMRIKKVNPGHKGDQSPFWGNQIDIFTSGVESNVNLPAGTKVYFRLKDKNSSRVSKFLPIQGTIKKALRWDVCFWTSFHVK